MAGEMNLMDLGFRVVDFWIKLLLRNLKSQISHFRFQIQIHLVAAGRAVCRIVLLFR